jgi:hypothetical protein
MRWPIIRAAAQGLADSKIAEPAIAAGEATPRSEEQVEDRNAELGGAIKSRSGVRIHCGVMGHGGDVLEAELKRMVEEDGVASTAREQAIDRTSSQFG